MDKHVATETTGETDGLFDVKNLLDEIAQPIKPAADVAEEKTPEEAATPEKAETETEQVEAADDEIKASEREAALAADLSPKAGYAPRLLRRGDVIDVSVVKLERDGVMVNAGGKGDYYIPLNRLTMRTDVAVGEIAHVGETMKVAVVKEEDEQGTAVLSKLKADQEEVWADVEKYFDEQTIVTAKVTKAIKGGLLVDIGVPCFLPQSQVASDYRNNLPSLVGQDIPVKVTEFDKKLRRIIASHRAAMQVIRQKQKKEFFTKIQPGDIYEGTVNGIAEFGAFVDIGYGVEGLVHLSELTYGRRRPVEEVVQKKDKVKVKVLKVDPETGKVSLSIKQTKPHPWETIEEDYPVGMILEGAVIRILTFGAIIELSEGVTGLLHISQISNDKIRKVEDVLNVGDILKVRVLEVLKDERKVKLSMKGVEGNESLFGREPGQETPSVETGSDTDATGSTFVQPEVVQPEAPAVENVEPEVPPVDNVEPEVVEPVESAVAEPEVVQPEAPAVDNVEPEVVQPEAPAVDNVEPEVVEAKPVEPEVVQPEAPAVDNVEPEVVEPVESGAAEPMSTEEAVRHEETEGPAEA
ncbi:30S ribosomal protein S1 [Candidatus Cryosericum terrychapinii]|nr:S1 RNA-binding domain-containing protein [Candidatus Cryosericum terrychapinii]